MSRDGFDITDFQRSDWEPQDEWSARDSFGFTREKSHGRGGSAESSQSRRRLEQFREIESSFDRLNARSHEQRAVNHADPIRDAQEPDRNLERERENYGERDRTYSLRPSEIHTLTEVAKLRVLQADDLTKFAYNGDQPRMESDLRHLMQLAERRATSFFKKESQQVLTVTKNGHRLVQQQQFVPDDQAIYSGFVKPKEADHDVALYPSTKKPLRKLKGREGKSCESSLIMS